MKQYDLAIINGNVYSPILSVFEKKRLFIKNKRIVSEPSRGEEWKATTTLDAAGCYVTPGLIDEHAHVNYQGSNLGISADILCPCNGITTVVDAGSTGFCNFDLFNRANIKNCLTNVLAYLNISPFGVECSFNQEESLDPQDFKLPEIEDVISFNSDIIRGIKIRIDRSTLKDRYTLESLGACIEVSKAIQGKGFHCPVVVHVANVPDPSLIGGVADMLRKGDVMAHIFQKRGGTIFNEDGTVNKSIMKARERGTFMDACNGRIHWSFETQDLAIKNGFLPDIISSDTVFDSAFVKPCFSLIHAMNTFLACGLSIENVIKSVTINPARCLGMYPSIGSLEEGQFADISILALDDSRPLKIVDRFGGERILKECLKPMVTIIKGKIVYSQINF